MTRFQRPRSRGWPGCQSGASAAKGLAALMLWRDDEILLHHRGMEAELCALAQRWDDNLLTGRSLDTAR